MSVTAAPRTVRISKPNDVVASYSVLLKQVRKEGLLNRRRRFYISVFAVLALAMGAAWTGFAFLGDTWFQLLVAAALGVVLTQVAFLGVQLAVFGIYMGASFAPNHKGMPVVPRDSTLDFFQKQVLTSRNIRGGSFIKNAFGGLNFQIEHHLFPDMPRPHLRRAAVIVREHWSTATAGPRYHTWTPRQGY